MTKKKILMFAMCLPAMFARAESANDSIDNQVLYTYEQQIMPLEPTYLEDVTEAANWDRNWFIDLKGGASAFLGNPLGCSDLFGRTQPVLQVGIGKWFTPAIGGRIVYQGMKFKDSNILKQRYNNVHADFLYNVTNRFNRDEYGLSKWDLIPYVGAGIIHHDESGRKPFALHYGIMARCKLCSRFHIAAELGGLTTFRDFDGVGDGTKLGDNMLNLSVGITYTFGKAGWKKVVDAKPYMQQNQWLMEYVNSLKEQNHILAKKNQEDRIALDEYRKILEIEGLLNQYRDQLPEANKPKPLYPRNDYSGLNSLRARLANRGWDGNSKLPIKCDTVDMKGKVLVPVNGSMESSNRSMNNPEGYNSWDEYLQAIKDGKIGIGAPVYFFFKLGTHQLTDVSQMVNLDEIARIAKQYNLKVRISGAADSATGTKYINDRLSKERADFLQKQMKDRGVLEGNISTVSEGGINQFSPVQANRNSCVVLGL